MDTDKLDIIIPAFNEGAFLYDNITKIHRVLDEDKINHHFILIDDGSTDNTWDEMEKLSKTYTHVTCIALSRNFGKEAALAAGLMESAAPLLVMMDSDLQHPPKYIKEMLAIKTHNQAVDIVECVKADRGKESVIYRQLANWFYRILDNLSGFEMANSSDFKLISREVVEAWKEIGESHVFIRGMFDWVGFTKVQIPFSVEERVGGHSKFSFWALTKMAVAAITSFSAAPLYLTIVLSGLFFLFAMVLGIHTIYNKVTGVAADGFSTVILLILILGAAILFCLGLIGAYISKIYDEVKMRPRYIIKNRIHSPTTED